MLGEEATNRIHSGYAEMPAQMQAAARFVLDHPQDVVLLSMRALARRAGVPAATMTRMVQRVGYAGFDDLRAVYLNDARAAPGWFSSKAQTASNVAQGTVISTDELLSYGLLEKEGYTHVAVKHGKKEWAIYDYRTQQLHHTNGVESFWRLFKHSVRGTHVSISQKHMKRYLDEFTFRANHRGEVNGMFDRLIAAF